MAKTAKRSSGRKISAESSSNSSKVKHAAKSSRKAKGAPSAGRYRLWMIAVVFTIAVLLAYVAYKYHSRDGLMAGDTNAEKKMHKTKGHSKTASTPSSTSSSSKTTKAKPRPKSASQAQNKDAKLPPHFKDFKLSIQKELKMTPTNIDGKQIKIKALKHSNSKSTVKAYVIENFLGDYECDNLIRIHKKYLDILNRNDPIMCFDSIDTLTRNLKELKLKYKASEKDFTKGTTCLNETFSSKLKQHFKWSQSMAFYPGENKFSTMYAKRIEQATGLKEKNGGKFQITAYPVGVGYKSHTDCVVYEGEPEKRDRFATILVYLQDVEEGGETDFPLLGIKVKPKKGLALVWNSMDAQGNCDPLSLHDAKKVKKGHKYIIQRWYYYHSFPSLGKRAPEPALPARKQDQPRVSCDMYEQGSCRWYDEWNYDHINEYAANTRQLI